MEAEKTTPVLVRLFRLWGVYARLDLLLLTRDLKSFLVWSLSDAITNIAAVTGMLFLAARFQGIGVWTQPQIVFMLGYAALVEGLASLFFNYNVLHISRRIGRGQMDHLLIQPQPLWMALLTEGFSPAFALPMVAPGIGMLLWAFAHLKHAVSIPALCLNMVASTAVLLGFQFLWGCLAFTAPRAAEEINSSTLELMSQLKQYPLNGAGTLLRFGLMTVLPVGFLAWIPCRALLGMDSSVWAIYKTPVAAVGFGLLAAIAFGKGMRYYARTGSQRYSDLGHRS
jgi:ABC-2 type transport system permease protein